jgi:hypothetical protein
MPTGNAVVDFGAMPGTGRTSATVTGQTSILSGSFVEAYLVPSASADHSVDEHLVDGPRILAGNVVAGTGFTIYAEAGDRPGSRLYGQYNVAWVWV